MNQRRNESNEDDEGLSSAAQTKTVQRNIRALLEARRQHEQESTWLDQTADAITAFSGSVPFVFLHIAWFTSWIVVNSDLVGLPIFDPPPFVLLTTIVSLEAIFLSVFVLISQNRQAKISDRHAELNLQVDLLAEREGTRILKIVVAIAKHLKIKLDDAGDVEELAQDVSPEELLRELKKHDATEKPSKKPT